MFTPLTRGIRQFAEWSLSYLHFQLHGVNASFRSVGLPKETKFEDIGDDPAVHKGVQFGGTISLGDDCRIGERGYLRGDISVGRGTNLVEDNRVVGDVTIGQYCAIAPKAAIQGANHEMHHPAIQFRMYDRLLDESLGHADDGPTEIGNDVWMGTKSVVLPGVTVGDGAIIGAGAVVTDDVEPYAIVGGVPAKRIGWRFDDDVRSFLTGVEWWNWDTDQIKSNEDFFHTNLQSYDGDPAGLLR